MITEGLATNTIRRTCGRAKQFFRFAVRKRLLRSNPFGEIKTTVGSNPDRQHFVTDDVARAVLDACPDAEWRLIFVLCRWGGLRCPSEVLSLRWADVDWARSRFMVRSKKTEHHEGKDRRWVPIFPELLPHLAAAFERATEGAEFIVTRCRDDKVNLRQQLGRIIERAGIAPWPKLFHNLRASRQTELAERYPIHVVCAWIGNSAAVAREHYLQVTDDHYASAAQNPAQSASDRVCQTLTGQTPDCPKVAPDIDLHLSSIPVSSYDYPQGETRLHSLAHHQTLCYQRVNNHHLSCICRHPAKKLTHDLTHLS